MSKTYAGHTLAEIKEAAAQFATNPDVVLAMVARLEELEREHDAARSASSPVESDWPHPDGFPAIAGMP
ncbi:MAG: hypothetical protein HYZ18_02825 [Pseudogulbenkiania sp.]|nr:hypothetical protein [Pseudogulbenkiania sp.]